MSIIANLSSGLPSLSLGLPGYGGWFGNLIRLPDFKQAA